VTVTEVPVVEATKSPVPVNVDTMALQTEAVVGDAPIGTVSVDVLPPHGV
jgi:hypothetical protein